MVVIDKQWLESIKQQKEKLEKRSCKGFFGVIKCVIKQIWIWGQQVVRFITLFIAFLVTATNIGAGAKKTVASGEPSDT
jgi:hypothetical protein